MHYRYNHKTYTNEPLEQILKEYPKLKDYFYGTKLDLDKIKTFVNPSVVYDYIHDTITKYDLINKMLDRLEVEGVIGG